MKNLPIQTKPTRLWFMAHGYKIVPNIFGNDVVFWVKNDGTKGCQFKNGKAVFQDPYPTTYENSKDKSDAHRKQRYLAFKDAFGHNKGILVSHAVYTAFVGPIPEGMVIDHLNGITTDNTPENLEEVTPAENRRRAQYLRIMRECEFDPRIFSRAQLHEIFSQDFDTFKTMLLHHKDGEV